MKQTSQALKIVQRLADLRDAMKSQGIDAYIVLTSDPHLSEYLPDFWKTREWLSGFTGSAGVVLVTQHDALLLTDSRYWVQAERQLQATGIDLFKVEGNANFALVDWLTTHLNAQQVCAFDATVMSVQMARLLQHALQAKEIVVRSQVDLFAKIWSDRPGLPDAPIFQHPMPYAARTVHEKLQQVRQMMQQVNAQWHVMTTLDDIMWLFNLRGRDVSYNPVFLSYAVCTQEQAYLFVALDKVPQVIQQALQHDRVTLKPYAEFYAFLPTIPAHARVLIDPARLTLGTLQQLPESVQLIEQINPTTILKSRKTAQEAQFIRQAMAQDGAALAEFFAWFEANLGKTPISELTIAEKLIEFRQQREGYLSPSFSTIAGFNENGALPHYGATPESYSMIEGDGLLLIDSGAQYFTGTTDITRVVPIGQPSDAQKRDFTFVLKGMIALSQLHFPKGISAPLLDVMARAPLWKKGLDYGHGTGHGVGYGLNVHEGPQSISYFAPADASRAMHEGMVTSNEPGLYRPGQWGVRIENLVLNVQAEQTAFGDFLKFETLTLCPIDTRCIVPALLTQAELDWLNTYHEQVRQRVAPLVDGAAKDWLMQRTQPFRAS